MKLAVKDRTTRKPPTAAEIEKQLRYGTAVGLTRTAQDAQESVVKAIKGTFNVRSNWTAKSNAKGIRIQSAKKNDTPIKAQVRTNADWLELHETGGTKEPKGKLLAIPTDVIRKTPLAKITKAKRPKNLPRSFIIDTPSGAVLFQRKYRGKRSRIEPAYVLEPTAHIKKQSTFYEPIGKVVKRRARKHIDREIKKAIRTMK